MACKNSSTLSDAPSARKPRTDGVQARERILLAALRLFAERGYASTPVRDIAHDAGVNIAAIAYYFGDKAGLYRSALYEPMCEPDDASGGDAGAAPFDAPGLALSEALGRYARHCLQPLAQGEASLLNVRLRFREAVEPTGMLDRERAARADLHRRLLGVLTRHAGLAAADAELEALAFSIFALVAYPYVGRDRIDAACPALLDAPDALDAWVARVADYAQAMAAADARRRTAFPLPRHPHESPT